MIRIDSIWLATEPMDMRAGTETALAKVIAVFGAAQPHCAYLFANRRANRIKVLVHDGFGIWLYAPGNPVLRNVIAWKAMTGGAILMT
ncbi:IS66 family insertion sequence element accessory protein TnpB [Pseudomonas quasicaspiana]|uniref:IS66 family insertion sequence element accessory protein TnpB n=1 Tax=Pseudomonas quasicaspiana TaxID=2829821 RepID=UPI001E5CFB19|nr:IS66 family insertion sequence element accessory protein TnpB [Pseudomonas quasicaspiana]MCD5975594.1 IS66 family insertion sequence element accessory protein TnpB [Pseudomonas quasicaspiana]